MAKGITNATRAMRRGHRNARVAIIRINARFGALIAREAAARAPVDEGDLRSTVRSILDELTVRIFAGGIDGRGAGKFVDYAEYVELGTARMRAQPFLFPAWERHRDAWFTAVAAAIRKAFTG